MRYQGCPTIRFPVRLAQNPSPFSQSDCNLLFGFICQNIFSCPPFFCLRSRGQWMPRQCRVARCSLQLQAFGPLAMLQHRKYEFRVCCCTILNHCLPFAICPFTCRGTRKADWIVGKKYCNMGEESFNLSFISDTSGATAGASWKSLSSIRQALRFRASYSIIIKNYLILFFNKL